MSQLKLIWYNDGKHNSNSVTVSVREFFDETPSNPISTADIVGIGSYFGSALEDFEEQLNEHIDALIKFRNEVVSTKRAYNEAVMVDCIGRPIEFTK